MTGLPLKPPVSKKGQYQPPASEETKRKISESMKGKNTWTKGKPSWNKGLPNTWYNPKGLEFGHAVGEKNHKWKGNGVGYGALHSWVNRVLGTPTTCENCGREGLLGSKINWANKSRQYLRDISDWLRLCVKCHRAYDKNKLIPA